MTKKQVRLSQCMIVKNEEDNIGQALSWGKGIVWEQIVVDTGSTDRTVEIAEQMGAKVFHFNWADDFSAAKNYAIAQASGNWIAFLDADEYFSSNDAKKLKDLLLEIEIKDTENQKPDFIRCLLIHLDDEKQPISTSVQDRIFRNIPMLRYHNRVHESLQLMEERKMRAVDATNLSIFHTGYSDSAYKKTDKIKRNAALLEKELEQNPENSEALTYLGDCLTAVGEYEKALQMYQKAIENIKSGTNHYLFILENSYGQIMRLLVHDLSGTSSDSDIKRWYEKAVEQVPALPDIEYWYGIRMAEKENWEKALLHFNTGLDKLKQYTGTATLYIAKERKSVYFLMARAAEALGRTEEVVKYAVLTLSIGRFQENVTTVLLGLLGHDLEEGRNPAGTVKLLQKLYHMECPKDKLYLLKCAKSAGFSKIESWIYSLLTPEELQGLL